MAQQQVLAAFALAGLVLIGWGSVFRWLCGSRVRDVDDLFGAFFEGWALLLGALQVWHLFCPVDERAALFAGVVAIVGLGLGTWRAWRRVARRIPRNAPALVLTALAAVWLSQQSLDGPRHGDAGGYYLPTILWMHAYPVVVGLGNLYAPYAYNQSYFLYAAAAELGPFAGRSYHIVNSLLLMGLLARGILGLWRVVWPRRAVRWNDLLYAFLLPGEIALALSIFLTSPAPDTGVFLIGAALFGSVLELANARPSVARFHLLAVVLFTLAGWTIKVSFAGMAAALLVVAPLGWHWRFRPSWREASHTATVAATIAVFMGIPWLIGNVLMSGCPFFPSAFAALDVRWRVHLDVQQWIQSDKYIGPLSLMWKEPLWVWRRLIGFGWGEPDVALPLAIGGTAMLVGPLLVSARRLFGSRRVRERLPWWIVLPPLVSLAFALRLTPMPRYAGATMWLVGITAVLLACGDWLRRTVLGRVTAAFATVVMSVWLASTAPTIWPGHRNFATAPAIQTDARVLASGLSINVPRGVEACFAAPLPCAPHPDPRLKLRRAGDLAGGFEIEQSNGE